MKKVEAKNFWLGLKESLDRPLFAMAPMANVTDVAFRGLFAKYGKPDVTWTEFVSADGLCSVGKESLLRDLTFSEDERPIVAQLFTGNPEKMRLAGGMVSELGFDGLDINMGCPDRAVEKQGSGSGHINDPENAVKVIESARLGAPEIPVSVKTRLGYNKVDMTWIKLLLKQRLPVLTIHLRTRKEMSDVPAHWEIMPEIVKMRDEISPETLILGNGDIETLEEAHKRVEETGCDGVMIGRGIFGNPWLFSGRKLSDVSKEERLEVMLEHARLFQEKLGDIKSFAIMKKHFKAYVSGWDGAKELRVKLMESETLEDVEKIVSDFLC